MHHSFNKKEYERIFLFVQLILFVLLVAHLCTVTILLMLVFCLLFGFKQDLMQVLLGKSFHTELMARYGRSLFLPIYRQPSCFNFLNSRIANSTLAKRYHLQFSSVK